MKFEFFTSTPSQTKKAGRFLAEEILKSKPGKKAFVVGLVGDLGGGKTTFLQGFSQGLKIKGKILSPTFIIMRRLNNFYHIDCYRIKKPQELIALGLKKIMANPKNIVAVEWADRVRQFMPPNTIWVNFGFINEKKRKIVIK
ncbi:tRNA threonylcarbamoyladenosine biosynthesis protein TsaE [subsurface metagenome]